MRVLVSIVGKRSEHWIGLFRALARRPQLELTVLAADLTPETVEALRALDARHERFRFIHSRHLIGEDRTGHMASIIYARQAFARCPPELDLIHVIGEASYPTTRQVLRYRDRAHPDTPVTVYGAQNVLQRFPWPFRSFEQTGFRKVTLATPVSEDALDVMRRKGYEGPGRVVPLGVDTDFFQPRPRQPEGPFTVGFVGRVEDHKGVRELLEAVERLGCRLLVVGDGSLRPWLEQSARTRGIADRVKVTGWVSHAELPGLLWSMHALAVPSVEIVQRGVLPGVGVVWREQFGRVLCEGMACGVPVVGSELGEIPRVIGPAGLTFPPGDADGLVAALAKVRNHAGLALTLGERGVERARSLYSWREIASSLSGIWVEAMRLGVPAVGRPHRGHRLARRHGDAVGPAGRAAGRT